MRTHACAPLEPDRWQGLAAEHRDRIEALIGPYLRARRRGVRHPVIDFLFTYYSARPAQVLRWHPGFGTALAGPAALREYGALRGYSVLRGCEQLSGGGVAVSEGFRIAQRPLLVATARLTRATASRRPVLGCFGLHEWAMVYRADETRHRLPLRLGRTGTDAVVESLPLRCTHFDAFRFFTPDAVPRNRTELTRAGRIDDEQPGCLHATMDLYRFCLRLTPLVPGELLADCFALALDARTLDMQAGPYDLQSLGYPPVCVETAAGRAEYAARQEAIAARGAALRERVSALCEDLTVAVPAT